jgi:hypothetical protein
VVKTVATAAALAALVAWSWWLRWTVLASSPYPIGVDGFYYPVQLRALLAHGQLAYHAAPLAFWWMAPIAAATDPITGAKLGAAIGGALVAVPAYGVGARLGGGRGPGLVAAAIASCSATSTYLSFEFAKQGIGLTVALAAVWTLLRALDKPTRARIGVAVAAAVAAVLAHELAGSLVAIAAVPAVIEEARGRGALRGRRLMYALVAAGIAAVAAAVIVLVRYGLVTTDLQWSAPVLVRPRLEFAHEPLVAGVIAVCAATVLVMRHRELPSGVRAVSWVAVAFGVAIALPVLDAADPQGLAMRLRVAAFVPLALCAAIALGAVRGRIELAILVAAVVAIAPRDREQGVVRAPPALVASAIALADHVPAHATVVVSERLVAFMIAWYTGAPVTLHPDSVPPAERVWVLLPLSSAAAGFSLEPALDNARRNPALDPPISLHPGHRDGFVLVTERTWQWILARLPGPAHRHWAAWPTI